MMGRARLLADYLTFPLLAALAVAEARALLARGVPSTLIIGLVMWSIALMLVGLERLRPERGDFVALDQPVATELAHYVFNYNLGYVLALPAIALVAVLAQATLPAGRWPVHWPLALQIAWAEVLAEAISYWQHRMIHRVHWYWPFHALHHSGVRLNIFRGARFHFVDIGPAVFLVLLPLVVLGAPDEILTWTAVLSGSLGAIQHANVRMRTPALLDLLICTPAVHRLHHSRDRRESDANFGTSVMLFDHVFGTYLRPRGPGPAEVGIERDTRRPGFRAQWLDPFRLRS